MNASQWILVSSVARLVQTLLCCVHQAGEYEYQPAPWPDAHRRPHTGTAPAAAAHAHVPFRPASYGHLFGHYEVSISASGKICLAQKILWAVAIYDLVRNTTFVGLK